MMELKHTAWSVIDQEKEALCALSDAIWEHPETSFQETFAAKHLCNALRGYGFTVESDLADIPTAFSARYGSGHPIIGILGEYDALSGMSQRADCFQPETLERGGNGHGCGHNLLGVGSLAAALAVKAFLAQSGVSGTVIYYGCPGEEGGSGKAFMARAGVFDVLDAALCWHPGDLNAGPPVRSLANREVLYRFYGKSAHAAISPHLGRSALDAVTLFNTGVQFLREHVIPEARIHYAVTDTGGKSPNVVQPYAEALYLIRAPRAAQVDEIAQRVDDVARGAALMTGTEVHIQFIKACADLIPNQVLSSVMIRNLQQAPLPEYTQADMDYAAQMQTTLDKKDSLYDMADRFGPQAKRMLKGQLGKPLHTFAVPEFPIILPMSSSTDVGDVSWLCPTSQIQAVTMCSGTPAHSWQRTAQGKSSIAHKGMLYAGKVLAGSAIDLFLQPELIEQAAQEWKGRLNGDCYQPIPEDVSPWNDPTSVK